MDFVESLNEYYSSIILNYFQECNPLKILEDEKSSFNDYKKQLESFRRLATLNINDIYQRYKQVFAKCPSSDQADAPQKVRDQLFKMNASY